MPGYGATGFRQRIAGGPSESLGADETRGDEVVQLLRHGGRVGDMVVDVVLQAPFVEGDVD